MKNKNQSQEKKSDSSVGKTENLRSGLVSPNPPDTQNQSQAGVNRHTSSEEVEMVKHSPDTQNHTELNKEELDLTKLKVGQVIDLNKINLGMIGELCEGNPKVIAIKFEIYEEKAGFHTELALKVKDYDKIMENFKDA